MTPAPRNVAQEPDENVHHFRSNVRHTVLTCSSNNARGLGDFSAICHHAALCASQSDPTYSWPVGVSAAAHRIHECSGVSASRQVTPSVPVCPLRIGVTHLLSGTEGVRDRPRTTVLRRTPRSSACGTKRPVRGASRRQATPSVRIRWVD